MGALKAMGARGLLLAGVIVLALAGVSSATWTETLASQVQGIRVTYMMDGSDVPLTKEKDPNFVQVSFKPADHLKKVRERIQKEKKRKEQRRRQEKKRKEKKRVLDLRWNKMVKAMRQSSSKMDKMKFAKKIKRNRSSKATCKMKRHRWCSSKKPYSREVVKARDAVQCMFHCEHRGADACSFYEPKYQCYAEWDKKNKCEIERLRHDRADDQNKYYAGSCTTKK